MDIQIEPTNHNSSWFIADHSRRSVWTFMSTFTSTALIFTIRDAVIAVGAEMASPPFISRLYGNFSVALLDGIKTTGIYFVPLLVIMPVNVACLIASRKPSNFRLANTVTHIAGTILATGFYSGVT